MGQEYCTLYMRSTIRNIIGAALDLLVWNNSLASELAEGSVWYGQIGRPVFNM